MARFVLNGEQQSIDVAEDTPLLWVIRESLGLTGTKFSCGIGLCGACTVHLNGTPIRSCIFPVSAAENADITTIEGLSGAPNHPLQLAWREHNVPQCGFCQSGQIMSAAALLAENPNPNDNEINQAMTGVLCRCGTYPRIRKAIHRAAKLGVSHYTPSSSESESEETGEKS